MIEVKKSVYEKVILVGLVTQNQSETKLEEYLEELSFLANTAGAEVVEIFTQKLQQPNPKTFLGTGKIDQIVSFCKENEVDTIIFDDELTPSQLKNLEKITQRKIIDRTNLILDIFAQRAKTSYARTQVELAQYEYYLPRLTNLWTHLERQKGGIGMRGPGETEIETDRRIIRERITLLKKKLVSIDNQMISQRKNRADMIRVALVGYTNVGKSSLMNLLSKSDVFAEDKLFATLDTTVRKVVISNLPFLLSDTVGFIRKLPTQLVASFKSTLDEVREADFLVHVLDVSHPQYEDHYKSVEQILSEINKEEKPSLLVMNKIDLFVGKTEFYDDENNASIETSIENLRKQMQSEFNKDCVAISVVSKDGIEELKLQLYKSIFELHKKRYPYNNVLFNYYDENGKLYLE